MNVGAIVSQRLPWLWEIRQVGSQRLDPANVAVLAPAANQDDREHPAVLLVVHPQVDLAQLADAGPVLGRLLPAGADIVLYRLTNEVVDEEPEDGPVAAVAGPARVLASSSERTVTTASGMPTVMGRFLAADGELPVDRPPRFWRFTPNAAAPTDGGQLWPIPSVRNGIRLPAAPVGWTMFDLMFGVFFLHESESAEVEPGEPLSAAASALQWAMAQHPEDGSLTVVIAGPPGDDLHQLGDHLDSLIEYLARLRTAVTGSGEVVVHYMPVPRTRHRRWEPMSLDDVWAVVRSLNGVDVVVSREDLTKLPSVGSGAVGQRDGTRASLSWANRFLFPADRGASRCRPTTTEIRSCAVSRWVTVGFSWSAPTVACSCTKTRSPTPSCEPSTGSGAIQLPTRLRTASTPNWSWAAPAFRCCPLWCGGRWSAWLSWTRRPVPGYE